MTVKMKSVDRVRAFSESHARPDQVAIRVLLSIDERLEELNSTTDDVGTCMANVVERLEEISEPTLTIEKTGPIEQCGCVDQADFPPCMCYREGKRVEQCRRTEHAACECGVGEICPH